jgi:hypothetical protein
VTSPILELAQRARDAGLPVELAEPLDDVPDTMLGVALDPQLIALYRITNGLEILDFSISPILDGSNWDFEDRNRDTRSTLDYLPFLHDVLLWGVVNRQLLDVTSIPSLADDHGRQPVVLLDAVEAPYIMPLASSFDRALTVIIEGRFHANDEWSEAFRL